MTDFIKSQIETAQQLQLTAVLKGLTANLDVSGSYIYFFFHDYTKSEKGELTMFSIVFDKGRNKCIAEMNKVKAFVSDWEPNGKK